MINSSEKSYDIYQHFSTPFPPLTIEIIIEENVYNYGRPLNQNVLLIEVYPSILISQINGDESGATSLGACFQVILIKARLTSIDQKSLQCLPPCWVIPLN